ncbi:MAG: PIG-L family deacetylase [Acidobacteria bacterium]|nr:PIG-L family deacetylase [Acidobacteriota bacterium]
MKPRLMRFGLLGCACAALSIAPRAQMRAVPLDGREGHVALGLALRHLGNAGIFMQATAHPDDENNGLLVMLNRGQGFRTVLATATRGNGGQNEIGPEIFEALGVLRTGELAAMHRFDGAEQYFTRAVDFGYSFGLEETFEKWGRDEITADYVRLIRMTRPDVVIALPSTGNAGGQHHMASSIIAHDAVGLAADPTKYPEQIREGLRPWQARKFYETAGGFGAPAGEAAAGAVTRVNTDVYDQLLGRTYAEIGTEARSMHKCQGMAQLLALPGAAASSYRLLESTVAPQPAERSLFDGIDTSLKGLARFAGSKPPRELTRGLSDLADAVAGAQRAFDAGTDAAALGPLLEGLHAVRVLRGGLGAMDLDEAARYELEFRLRQKEGELQQAALLANAIHVDVLADDGVVVPGQEVAVNVIVANRGPADITVKQVRFGGFTGAGTCTMTAFTGAAAGPGQPGTQARRSGAGAAAPEPELWTLRTGQAAHCEPTLTVPAAARVTEPYWHREQFGGRYTFDADAPFGLPYRPTPFYVQVTLATSGGEEVIDGLPVQYRYGSDIFSGEKRSELLVVPPLSVRVTPDIALVPAEAVRPAAPPARPTRAARASATAAAAARAAAATREIRVTVLNDTPGALQSEVALEIPDGWAAVPAKQAVSFTRADESATLRFQVRPAVAEGAGDYRVRAAATANGQTFTRGFTVVEYPHISRYHVYEPSETAVKIADVETTPGLVVGYVMGVGDQMPPAIEQLGAKVELLGAADLAWGDLSRFDAIVTGVRAYERRADLRANNARLLDYVRNGGTMLVQYNKFEFNEAQYGPYPAQVSSNRVTDEISPVKILDPENRVFTTPNRITPDVWDGWIQERGLYFLGEKDSRYRDLLLMADDFPYNTGVKEGSLVQARYGKGVWMYIGVNFWRQMPEGVEGAYKLFANLLSVGESAPPVAKPASPSR